MRRISITKFWWAPVLLLCTTGCMVSLGGWGSSSSNGVSVRNGTVYLNGTKLPFERWVDVNAEMGDASVAYLSTSTGPLALRGTTGSSVSLQALVHSELEGDGGAQFVAGKLELVKGQGKAIINAIRGTIPNNVSVNLATGTGIIRLANMQGEGTLKLASGTGATASAKVKSAWPTMAAAARAEP